MTTIEEIEDALLEIGGYTQRQYDAQLKLSGYQHSECGRQQREDYFAIAVEGMIALQEAGIIPPDAEDEQKIALVLLDIVRTVVDEHKDILLNAEGDPEEASDGAL